MAKKPDDAEQAPEHSDTEETYSELGYPLNCLPRLGQPMTDMALLNTIQPLLEGVHALLMAQAEYFRTQALDMAAHHGTTLLASQVEMVLNILERWWEERDHADRQ